MKPKERRNRAITETKCPVCRTSLDIESDTGDLHCFNCNRYWRFMGELDQEVEHKHGE